MRVTQNIDDGKIYIDQTDYIKKMLSEVQRGLLQASENSFGHRVDFTEDANEASEDESGKRTNSLS